MNQINAAVATANETQNQTANHNPAASSDQKHRLINAGAGFGIVWKLKCLANSVGFISQELTRLNSGRIAITEEQSNGLDRAIFSLEQEAETIRNDLLEASGAEVFENVIKNIRQAEERFTFLLMTLSPGENGESRFFTQGDIQSLILLLNGIESSLHDAMKQMEWFGRYRFHGNANLYKDSPNLIMRIKTAIDDLDAIDKSFSCQDDKCEFLNDRESVTAEVRRLVEAIWDMSNMLPEGDLEKDLNLAHDLLLHVYRVTSSGIWLESTDLVSFSLSIDNARDILKSVLAESVNQYSTGGTH